MSFNDIFKSSFLEDVSAISIVDMALALVLAFGLGVFIFLIYKKTYAGVMYSSSFGVTLVALTIMIAESKPEEKEMMVNVIMNCLI